MIQEKGSLEETSDILSPYWQLFSYLRMRLEDHHVDFVEVVMFLVFSPGQTQNSEYLSKHVHIQTVTGEVAFVFAVSLPQFKFMSQMKKAFTVSSVGRTCCCWI